MRGIQMSSFCDTHNSDCRCTLHILHGIRADSDVLPWHDVGPVTQRLVRTFCNISKSDNVNQVQDDTHL